LQATRAAPPVPGQSQYQQQQSSKPLPPAGGQEAQQQQQQAAPKAPVVKPLQAIKDTPAPPSSGGATNAGAGAQERRISTMTEAQITQKLRSVVSNADPSKLYSKIKKVGQGASGAVYVAKTLETGVKVAIKQMDLSAQPRKELIVSEILVMKDSKHPNIVNFLDSFLVKGSELWVVMEYMEGGALTDVIENNTLEEDQISSICFEVRRTSSELNSYGKLMLWDPLRRHAKACSTCITSISFTEISNPTMCSWMPKDTSRSVSLPLLLATLSHLQVLMQNTCSSPSLFSRLWVQR
jgi:hypothetical protein